MKFMGYELEELKGATAVLRNGSRQMILKVVNLGKGGLDFPFAVKFYDDDFDDTYTEGGICYLRLEVGRDIISIELPKKDEPKSEYEVFEITKYADLDVLETRILADEFEKITNFEGYEVNGSLYYTRVGLGVYRLGKGDTVHLYPKKLSKLERILKAIDYVDCSPSTIRTIREILEENN